MSKYNFGKRLQRMLDKECEITRTETNIARKTAKYYETATELKTTLAKHDHDLGNYRNKVEKLRRHNERLEKFTQEEEERLAAIVKNVQELQRECEVAKQRQIEQRKITLMRMNMIRKIKETTQTYFRMDALPHKFQGVKVCDKETSTEWKPFDNDVKQWIQFIEEQLEVLKQKQSSTEDQNMIVAI